MKKGVNRTMSVRRKYCLLDKNNYHYGKHLIRTVVLGPSSVNKPSQKDPSSPKACGISVAVGFHKVLQKSHKRMKSYMLKQLRLVA